MSTKIIKLDVENIVAKELELSYEQFPEFNSPHEGWAVIREEVDELVMAVEFADDRTQYIWSSVKANEDKTIPHELSRLENMAVGAACEAIQVAAMCRKYRESLLNNEGEN